MIGSAKQPYLILDKRLIGSVRDGLEIAAETEIRLLGRPVQTPSEL